MSTIDNGVRAINDSGRQRSFWSAALETKGRLYARTPGRSEALGCLVTCTAGRILSVDGTVSALLDFTPEYCRGKQILDYVADAERPFVETILLKHALAGISQKFVTTLKPERGHPFEAQISVGISQSGGEQVSELQWTLNLPRSRCDRGTSALQRRIQAVLEEINRLKLQDLSSRLTIEKLERRIAVLENDLGLSHRVR